MCVCTHIFAAVCTARCMFTQYMFTCGDQKIPSGHIPEVCFIFFSARISCRIGACHEVQARWLTRSRDLLSLSSQHSAWMTRAHHYSGFLFACIFKTSEASFTNYIYSKISYLYTIYLDHIKQSLLSNSPWNLPKRVSPPTLCPILFITL